MGETKQCGSCRLELPLADFHFRDKERTRPQSYCRSCSNESWRRWYAIPANKARHLETLGKRRRRRIQRNKALIEELKSVPCADCGGRFPTEAMDFDHLEDKDELISKLVYTVSTRRLLEEIAKCEVVCANCHRTRTAERIRGYS